MIYLLILFFFLILALLFYLSLNNYNIIQFPFWSLIVMLGWVFPQFVNIFLLDDLPSLSFIRFVLYSFFAVLFILLGYNFNKRPLKLFRNWKFSPKRLLYSSLVLSVLGYFFWYKVGVLSSSMVGVEGGWTGVITIYVFLGEMLNIGFFLALVLYIYFPSKLALGICVIDFYHLFTRAFFSARREETMLILFIILFFLWWKMRFIPSRYLILFLFFIGIFFINSVEVFRNASFKFGTNISIIDRISLLTDSHLYDSFFLKFGDEYFGQEVREGAYIMEGAATKLEFDFGTYYWDRFVHSYIPGQLVGNEVKSNLKFSNDLDLYATFGYSRLSEGITHTGMADSFRAFWYFGLFIFFLIGYIISRIWKGAENGNFVGKVIILSVLVKGLLAITHTSSHFFLHFIYLFIFLLPFLYFSRVKN